MKLDWPTIFVALGGALGALTRYGISLGFAQPERGLFPWGTLVANLSGCFLVGLLVGSGLLEKNSSARLGLGTGYLGALTTLSAFGVETIKQLEGHEWSLALANVVANLALGLIAVFLGMVLGRRFLA